MVYSVDGITRSEALVTQNRSAALLSYKLKREYSEMRGLARTMMTLEIVRFNSLLPAALGTKGCAFGSNLS